MMSQNFNIRPKIVRGAFIEQLDNGEPLFVVFQFNPVQLTRGKQLQFDPSPSSGESRNVAQNNNQNDDQKKELKNLREFHSNKTLNEIHEQQNVTIQEETISFEIRLDATEKLEKKNPVAMKFGVGPELATLEMMVQPKDDRILTNVIKNKFEKTHRMTHTEKPPLILFTWGKSRVLPVNIQSLSITETDFDTQLNPIRATVQVNLTVIEGSNPVYAYSQKIKSMISMMRLFTMESVTEIVIPG